MLEKNIEEHILLFLENINVILRIRCAWKIINKKKN